MNKQTVLSLEQALSLSYATQRFVHLGWRVIRIEATPSGNRLPGDPNRYVGKAGDSPDRRAYFIGPNVGKESISLNLKTNAGREVLHRLIKSLPTNIFTCNTLPKRYKELGIDYETLIRLNPALIWAGISAMGPEYPDTPGYDPPLQALAGFMDLTGDSDGPPTLCGVPFVDLKAGDEVFANVCLALAERAHSGSGSRIDVSMLQAASSWLLTTAPLLDLGYQPSEVRRSGSEHREFVPVNVYPTSDGFIYIAIGNDVQWSRLVSLEAFGGLDSQSRSTNEERRADREAIHTELRAITGKLTTSMLSDLLGNAGLVASPINSVSQAIEYPPIRDRLLEIKSTAGKSVRLPPPSVEREHLNVCGRKVSRPPGYGEHTDLVLRQAGFDPDELADLRKNGTIA